MDHEKKEIRFIDSRYRELFRIKDGDSIEISYPDREKVTRKCTFIDEYHTKVGSSVFHICEFAERMEALGAVYRPAEQREKKLPYTGKTPEMARGRGR